MTPTEMKTFLATVAENYRFSTKLDLEILERVASALTLNQAESILTRVREVDKDPGRIDIPAFTARARALLDHINTKPSEPMRLVDWVRQSLGRESCDENGEALSGVCCVTKYFEKAWRDLKEQPESSWRNKTRGMIRRQCKVALMELHWDEDDADEVAARVVEMPRERTAKTTANGV